MSDILSSQYIIIYFYIYNIHTQVNPEKYYAYFQRAHLKKYFIFSLNNNKYALTVVATNEKEIWYRSVLK